MGLTFLHHFNAGDASLSLGFHNRLCLLSSLPHQLGPAVRRAGDDGEGELAAHVRGAVEVVGQCVPRLWRWPFLLECMVERTTES